MNCYYLFNIATVTFLHCYAICKDAMVQNFILKKFRISCKNFRTSVKFQDIQDKFWNFRNFRTTPRPEDG